MLYVKVENHNLYYKLLFPRSYEVNLAAKDSPLKIVRHYQPTTTVTGDNQSDSALRVNFNTVIIL